MQIAGNVLHLTPLWLIIGLIDCAIFLTGYGVLRALHISVHWVTWLVGGLMILLSGVTAVGVFLPASEHSVLVADGLLGGFSFLVAVYSASQWATRRWYLQIRRQAAPWLVQQSRDLLLFMRRHHLFFGVVVLLTATAHGLSYWPVLARESTQALVTGLVVWGALAGLAGLGLWLELAVGTRRLPPRVRLLHIVLAVLFFALFIVHLAWRT